MTGPSSVQELLPDLSNDALDLWRLIVGRVFVRAEENWSLVVPVRVCIVRRRVEVDLCDV